MAVNFAYQQKYVNSAIPKIIIWENPNVSVIMDLYWKMNKIVRDVNHLSLDVSIAILKNIA